MSRSRPPLSSAPPGPPADPRESWAVPAPGELPVVARLDELTCRVLAPNSSPMTLDGTNTYVLAEPGVGEAVVVDPGPDDAEHLARVEALLAGLDAQCRWVVVTHSHVDHAAAAPGLARRLGARVVAASTAVAGPADLLVSAAQRVPFGSTSLTIVETAGHTRDHIALRLENGSLLVGDHVLGRGTSVVAHPEGDLLAYLESLRRVLALGPDVLYPGHGPELREDPGSVLRYYLEHRRFREQQIVAVLGAAEQALPPRDLVCQIYADIDPDLWPAAEHSTRAALEKLRHEEVIDVTPEGSASLRVR